MELIQGTQVLQIQTLSRKTVLAHTSYCTVREQEEQHLIYNTKTDEMYLVPKIGIYLYELCDGLATIGDIEDMFFCVLKDDRFVLNAQLIDFFEKLVKREILKIAYVA